MTTDTVDLAKVRQLLEKATEGPWHACHDGKCSCGQVWHPDFPVTVVTRGEWGDTWPAIRLVGESSMEAKAEAYIEKMVYGSVGEEMAAANAALIALTPTLARAYVAQADEIKALKEENERLKTVCTCKEAALTLTKEPANG